MVAAASRTPSAPPGSAVAARKPAQSFAPGERPTDAEVLAAARPARRRTTCARRTATYERRDGAADGGRGARAAAVHDRRPRHRAPLARRGGAVGLVEGAGGPRSPIAADGDTVDLAAALAPDLVVLVADAGLGTINAVRLAVAPFTEVLPGTAVVVALNRFGADPLHELNRRHLVERAGLDVVTDPAALAERLRAGS